MKNQVIGNPAHSETRLEESFYSVSAILRRRGRVVFWIVFIAMMGLFALSATAQDTDGIRHFSLERTISRWQKIDLCRYP